MSSSINIPNVNGSSDDFEDDSNFIDNIALSKETLLKVLIDEVKFMNSSIKNVNANLDEIKERVNLLERHNYELGNVLENHISFISNKYDTYKNSLDYIKDKVNYFTGSWLKSPKKNSLEHASL